MSKKKAFGPDIRKNYSYRELPIGAVSVGVHDDTIKTGDWRISRPLFKTHTPPCNEACPAGVDVRGFITLMKQGLFRKAHQLYLEENPFPAICGRVCDHPCEGACNRKEFDQAVSINTLERCLADYESAIAQDHLTDGKRVAVIGSGPAGLSGAYYLSRLGHAVTVFEAQDAIGGLLRSGIPRYRLPLEVVEKEVQALEALNIQFNTGYRINERNWNNLKDFDAILLAHGAGKHLPLPIIVTPQAEEKIFLGLEVLQTIKMGGDVALGQRVAIVGGGNTAVDTARVAKRQGAATVIIYRRSRTEMPAFDTEIEEALKEGVDIIYLTSPIEVGKTRSGLKIKCVKNKLSEPDAGKRPLPIPIEGSDFYIEADAIITAVGEISDLSFIPEDTERVYHSVKVDDLGSSNKPGVFACGDLVSQPRSVAHAIGSAKRAAIGIDCYCRGNSPNNLLRAFRVGKTGNVSFSAYQAQKPRIEPQKVVHFEDLNPGYFQYAQRIEKPRISKDASTGFEEIFGNLSLKEASAEAQRCFSCGMCFHCDNCFLFCPDGSVLKAKSKPFREIDLQYCKGCGICENECPVGVIEMEKEG